MLPLTIHHDSRSRGTIRLYAESEEVQLTWKTKLEEAILLRQKSSRVFEIDVMATEEFLTMGGSSNVYPPENRTTSRTITCATPFGMRSSRSPFMLLTTSCAATVTRDGRTLLAIGCTEGLWIGNGKGLQCRSLKILSMSKKGRVLSTSSFLLGASHPRPAVRGDRRIRSHHHPFQRSTSHST